MDDSELADVVENLRLLGSDVYDVEAKRAETVLPKSVRETLSAFANTAGGTIILGLDESRGFAATGVADSSKLAADLGSMCSDDMSPPLRPLIRQHVFEGVQLVVAEVPELAVADKPCFYTGAGMTRGSYVRVSDGDRRLTSYEVQMMLASRGQPREDERPVEGAMESDLDALMVDQFVERLRANKPYAFRDRSRAEVLRLTKVMVEDESNIARPSLAGILALGEYPQTHFPQLMLTFVHYPTREGEESVSGERFIDNVSIEGSIPVMVREAMTVLRRNMTRRSVVAGYGRTDVWEYPETALREAIVNALVHRDLSGLSHGTQVQVEMYPDRLVVRNPGGLFGPVSVHSLAVGGVSSARNGTLLKILEDVSLVGENRTVCENRGSGIRAMINALRDARMGLPKFDDNISSFTVIFPNHTLMSDEVVAWLTSLDEEGLTEGQLVGLAMLRQGDDLDNLTYRGVTGVDSRQATSELQNLVARELVEQEGIRRWAKYRLHPRLLSTPDSVPSQRRRLPADRREEILNALGDAVMSRSEIAAATGLSNQVVIRWLRTLRDEGRVEIPDGGRPQSKNTRYRRVPQPEVAAGMDPLFSDGV